MVNTRVQCGTCLRVWVAIDVTWKLIRGRKINFEEGEARWVHFKYERLPNLYYRCGLLEHDLKDCLESTRNDKEEERRTNKKRRLGVWLYKAGGWRNEKQSKGCCGWWAE